MLRVATLPALSLWALSPGLAGAVPPVEAELHALGTGQSEMRARVEDAPGGYRLTIRCEDGCSRPAEFTEVVGDTPLGLFQIWDGDGLLISTWAGGVAYVVRVYFMTPTGVHPVLEVASRSAPSFALDHRGRMTVTTDERLGGPRDGLRTTIWCWNGAHFSKR